MGRRANGEHSIYQRGDGRWCAAIYADEPATGERKRTVLYGRTRTEVRAKLKAAAERAEHGAPVRDAKATVGAWLAEWRDGALEASNRKATTKGNYSTLSRKHLEPAPFGVIALDRLRPSDIDRLMLELKAAGLADSSRQRIFNVLRAALADAVRDGLLARSPMRDMKQPKASRPDARFLSAVEARALIEAARPLRYHDLLAFIAGTGIRKGEALALRWSDVDLEGALFRVRGTLARVDGELVVSEPKTRKSRRDLPLSPGMVAMLKAHRKQQAAERLRAGNLWRDSGLVFTTEFGGPVEPSNVLRAVKWAAERAGVEGATVHTLRHSAATVWLENGVNLKAVSDLLGHADIKVTGDIYGHVSEGTSRAAMDLLSEALGF